MQASHTGIAQPTAAKVVAGWPRVVLSDKGMVDERVDTLGKAWRLFAVIEVQNGVGKNGTSELSGEPKARMPS